MKIITCHKNTDFDSLASLVAGTLIYPDAVAVLPRQVNANVQYFLSIHKHLLPMVAPDDIELDSITSLVVMDTHQWRRLDECLQPLKDRDVAVEVWDHHEGQCDMAGAVAHRSDTGANVTQLVAEIRRNEIEISPMLATLFLAGIYEDTGNLTFSGTCAEDAYAAGYLLAAQGDLTIVATFLGATYGEAQQEVLLSMLESGGIEDINGLRVSINLLSLDDHVEMLSLVVHKYRELLNADIAFGVFSKGGKRLMVIGRSKSNGPDVGRIMDRLGGGGHPNAGSAVMKSATAEAAAEMIRTLIAGGRMSSVRVSDLMSFPVFTLTPDTPMAVARARLHDRALKGAPVMDGDALVGMITQRHFKRLTRDSQWESPVKAFMRREVVTVDPGMSPSQAARKIITRAVGHLPVVENGALIGIVTRSDLMVYFYDLLPA